MGKRTTPLRKHCGSQEMSDDWKFCPWCGDELPALEGQRCNAKTVYEKKDGVFGPVWGTYEVLCERPRNHEGEHVAHKNGMTYAWTIHTR